MEGAIISEFLSEPQEIHCFAPVLPVGLGRQNIMHAAYASATANLMFANRRKPYCVHIAMRLLFPRSSPAKSLPMSV